MKHRLHYLLFFPCLLPLTPGCGNDRVPPGGQPDYQLPRDFGVRPLDFSARPADLSATVADDLASPDDASAGDSGIPDLRMPRDLAGRDLAGRDLSIRDLAVVRDLTVRDLAVSVDAGPTPDLTQGDGGASCHPILSELMVGTAGSGNDEFVELYNPCPTDVTLTGWKLCYRAAGNVRPVAPANDANSIAFPNGTIIKAGTWFVACAAPYGGKCDWKYNAQGIMANAGGAVGIRDGNGLLMNSVGWGTASPMNAFVQTAPAPAPPIKAAPGGSIGRIPDATDTFDNSKDFKVTTKVTPGAANQ